MHIADHPPAIGAIEPLQAVADDGGTQMPHMHGFGDVGAAEIDHYRLAVGCGRRLMLQWSSAHVQRRVGQIQIQETRPGDLHFAENRVCLQARGNLFGDGAGIGFRSLGRRQRAVALELRQVRPIGGLHKPEIFRKPFRGERLAGDARKFGSQRCHDKLGVMGRSGLWSGCTRSAPRSSESRPSPDSSRATCRWK